MPMPVPQAAPMAPKLLPSGPIGMPHVAMDVNKKPGQRLPHFAKGLSEASPKPGIMSNGGPSDAVSTESFAPEVGEMAAEAVIL